MNEQNNSLNERKSALEFIIDTYYSKFSFLNDIKPIEEAKAAVMEKYLNNSQSLSEVNEDLKEIIKENYERYKKRYDKKNVEENHKEIYSKLSKFVRLLNEYDVDYQLAGALCGYIKYGQESDRVHDDIDISVNEKDIDKLKMICQKLGLEFHDNRLNSPRVLKNEIPSGEHEVVAQNNESDFHIGAFCFERTNDGSVISKGYYHDEDGNPCIREEIYAPDIAQEIYGHEYVEFNGMKVYITPPEYVYSLKNYTKSAKDLHDIEFLDDKIDKSRVARINSLCKTGKIIEYVSATPVVDESAYYENDESEKVNTEIMNNQNTLNDNPLFPKNNDVDEKKSDDISNMIDEAIATEKKVEEEKNNVDVIDKPKTLIKSNANISDNEDGFTTKSALISCIVMMAIVIAVIVVFYSITG